MGDKTYFLEDLAGFAQTVEAFLQKGNLLIGGGAEDGAQDFGGEF